MADSPRTIPIDSDSGIRARVGDLGRPRAALPLGADVSHLPGQAGLGAGLRTLVGTLRHGVAHQIELRRRFGDVFTTPVGRTPMVFVAGADHVGSIARNTEGAWSAALAWRHWHEGLDRSRATYDSLVGLDFVPHRDLRRWVRPAFSSEALESYCRDTRALVAPAVSTWLAEGSVAFKPAISDVFMRLADRAFLGLDDAARSADFNEAMADLYRGPKAWVRDRCASPTWRRAARGWRTVFDMLRDRVAAKRAGAGDDLFSRLAHSEEEVDWLDDDVLVSVLVGILGASYDTAAAGITSMAYLLAVHPRWQDRLRIEALSLGPAQGAAGLRRLTELEAAWKETLRLYPVANALPRRALHEVHLGPHRIPAGAFVMALLGPSMRDPAHWAAPDVFDPGRFFPDRSTPDRGAYLPYGAGPHACVGARLSTLQALTVFHELLSRGRFRLARPYRARHTFGPLGTVSGNVALTFDRL